MNFERKPAQPLYVVTLTYDEAKAIVRTLEGLLFDNGEMLDTYDPFEPIGSLYYGLEEKIGTTDPNDPPEVGEDAV